MLGRLFGKSSKVNPQAAAANRQGQQAGPMLQQLRRRPVQRIQKSKYGSIQNLEQQDPYAQIASMSDDSAYGSMGSLQQKQPQLVFTGTQKQARNMKQPQLVFTGTPQQQKQQQARKMKLTQVKMDQKGNPLYSTVTKQPRYAGVTFVDQQGSRQSSTDYQPVKPFKISQRLQEILKNAQHQRRQAKKNQQPVYQMMRPAVYASQKNEPSGLKQRNPRDRLPQLPAQPYARAVRQAQSKLSNQQLQNIARRAQMVQQELQSPYSTLAETLADTGYNRRFAKEVIRFYSLMKFYDTFEQSLKTYVNSVSMSDIDKRKIINNIEETIGELKERIKTAKQQGKYSQENKVGVKYFDTPRNLIEFINEVESREKKLLTEVIVAIQKSCKRQQPQ